MIILRILADIDHNKTEEFANVLNSVRKQYDSNSTSKWKMYKNLEIDDRFYFEQEWDNEKELSNYLNCTEFKYLQGAITVLGNIVGVSKITTAKTESIII